MFSFNSYSKVCEISIVKSFNDLKEKIKICDIGDKLYLNYDIKLIGEELVVNLCSLKDTIIFKEESKIIHKNVLGILLVNGNDNYNEMYDIKGICKEGQIIKKILEFRTFSF